MSEIPIFKFVLNYGLSDQYLPQKGTELASGWDVRSTDAYRICDRQYVKINLGFRVFSPPGWWLELRPRSSSFGKKSLHALYGVIDEDYEGNCIFAAQFLPEDPSLLLEIKEGEAIGQLLPVRRQEMIVEKVTDEEYKRLCQERNSTRGTGGFGSTTR